MKKLFTVCIFAIILSSCQESDTDRYDRFMSELECPVILVGKTDKAVDFPSVVVRDGKGRVRTMVSNGALDDSHGFTSAIADSRNIGDTLKPCNCKPQK